jgi:hypothetical protein
MGRSCEGQADLMGWPRPALDRGRQKRLHHNVLAIALRQQACPHRVGVLAVVEPSRAGFAA